MREGHPYGQSRTNHGQEAGSAPVGGDRARATKEPARSVVGGRGGSDPADRPREARPLVHREQSSPPLSTDRQEWRRLRHDRRRRSATWLIGDAREAEGLPRFTDAVRSPDETVAKRARVALAQRRVTEAEARLIRARAAADAPGLDVVQRNDRRELLAVRAESVGVARTCLVQTRGDGSSGWVRPPRVARCGWTMSGAVGVHGGPGQSAHLSGVERCASIWSCPCCSAVIRAERAREIDAAVQAWQERGGSVVFVTLTMRHRASDALATTLDAALLGWRGLLQGSPWKRARAVRDRRLRSCSGGDPRRGGVASTHSRAAVRREGLERNGIGDFRAVAV